MGSIPRGGIDPYEGKPKSTVRSDCATRETQEHSPFAAQRKPFGAQGKPFGAQGKRE